ncbi:hypothetical protein IC575_028468 [Cucumis melo]
MLIVQIYVDDIMFGSTNSSLCEEFSKCMHNEFEMSMMGELSFFLGFQIKQLKDDIFISQEKYTRDLLKRFKFNEGKIAKTPMSTTTKLDIDEKGKFVNIKTYRGYSDADFAGSLLDRKSTSGTFQFLGSSLVSWFSKKQNSVALSTTEVEYIDVASCCAQILWMKQTFCDFGLKFDNVPIFYDNSSAINLTKNPIHHSRTLDITLLESMCEMVILLLSLWALIIN